MSRAGLDMVADDDDRFTEGTRPRSAPSRPQKGGNTQAPTMAPLLIFKIKSPQIGVNEPRCCKGDAIKTGKLRVKSATKPCNDADIVFSGDGLYFVAARGGHRALQVCQEPQARLPDALPRAKRLPRVVPPPPPRRQAQKLLGLALQAMDQYVVDDKHPSLLVKVESDSLAP